MSQRNDELLDDFFGFLSFCAALISNLLKALRPDSLDCL
jgi:hypothetical protein